MSVTNIGAQEISFQYNSPAKGETFNKLSRGINEAGLYSGGDLTKVSNAQVQIDIFVSFFFDSLTNTGTKVETTDWAIIAVSSTEPYIIARFQWLNTINNYADLIAVSAIDIEENDLILGKAVYDGTVLMTFDYSEKSWVSNYKEFETDSDFNFRVIPTDPYSDQVYVKAGKAIINAKQVEITSNTLSPSFANFPISANGRTDLICINDSGSISIIEGEDTTGAPTPSFDSNVLPLAKISFPVSATEVQGQYIELFPITDIYSSNDTTRITELETSVSTLETNTVKITGDQTIAGIKTFSDGVIVDGTIVTQYINLKNPDTWSQVGSSLSLVSSITALTALSSTDVAIVDIDNNELKTYRFDGSIWSQVGTGLGLGNTGTSIALTALSSTDVAFIGTTPEELTTYRFDGSIWSQVGTGLSISGVGNVALTALSSTEVAFMDSTIQELKTYQFDGSTWSQMGTGLSILSSISNPALTALSSTDVAFMDATEDLLKTYQFDGSTWSQIGTGLSISGAGLTALTTLSSTDIAFIDGNLDDLRTYQFDGSTWSQIGTGLSISGIGATSLTTLSSTDIAFIDSNLDELRTYQLSFSDFPPNPAFGTL